MLKYLIISVLLLVSVALPNTFIINGHMPADLSVDSLYKQYCRIYTVLNPKIAVDTATITVIFYKQSEGKMLGVRLPEWGGGGAIGRDSIVIPLDRPGVIFEGNYHKILVHEITHIALSRVYGFVKVPRWFHEGLAMVLAGEISFDDQLELSKALLFDRIMSLDSVEYLNRFSATRAKVAYCVSHFAVQFLLDSYGYDLLPELFDATMKRHSFSRACIEVFGLSSREYNEIIRRKITDRYRYFFLFSDYSFFGLLLLILSTIGYFITRHRNHLRQLRMEQEELQLSDNGEEPDQKDRFLKSGDADVNGEDGCIL